MPDITMCSGKKCNKANTCYRFTAKAYHHWQSYFTEPPLEKDGSCDYYWKD